MKHLLLIGVLSMSACEAPAIRQIESANSQTRVELITAFEGVRLYRIDVGDSRIYVAVQDKRLEVAWDVTHIESDGKTTTTSTEHLQTQTMVRR